MQTISTEKLPEIETRGGMTRLNFDAKEVTKEGMNGPETYWECTTAVIPVGAQRDAVIQAIIGSKFSLADEIALINNQAAKPDEYNDYQAFRVKAKSLAAKVLG
jgi:hypothetical protein